MEEEAPLPYISDEILMEILYRLPVKSLVRFRTVSKYWRSLFSHHHPEFVARYSSINHGINSHAYLLKYPSHFALLRGSQLSTTVKITPPPPSSTTVDDTRPKLTVVGSIDGVFCLVYENTRFVLWNPSTRDIHYPPQPKILEDSISKCFLGFACFENGGFGIVRIVRKDCRHQWQDGDPYCCTQEIMEAENYDSSNDNWTKIGNPPKNFLLCTDECSAIVHGTPYWCTYARCTTIISFNPSLQKFHEFDGPRSSVEGLGLGWRLGEISGSLLAFIENKDMDVGVWKMVGGDEEGSRVSWVKHFTVVAPLNGVGKVVKCFGNGELAVTSIANYPHGLVAKLSLYDPWTQMSTLLSEFPAQHGKFPEVFLYVESLVSSRGSLILA